ncbi:unnamed protein product [Hymenolepis diminuta]|uniref:Integrase catalytic domain-containing protein n=1 Tax=Hymenolepis diminuta TaxID=6216 RepID=A0A564YKE9_HYMDI|nr:unnamed protein product [Hymenolepis diminuta]
MANLLRDSVLIDSDLVPICLMHKMSAPKPQSTPFVPRPNPSVKHKKTVARASGTLISTELDHLSGYDLEMEYWNATELGQADYLFYLIQNQISSEEKNFVPNMTIEDDTQNARAKDLVLKKAVNGQSQINRALFYNVHCSLIVPIHLDFARPVNGLSYLAVSYCMPETTVTNFCRGHTITHVCSPSYYPRPNGQAERLIDILKRALQKSRREWTKEVILDAFFLMDRTMPYPALDDRSSVETPTIHNVIFPKE